MNNMYRLAIIPFLTLLFITGCSTHSQVGDTSPPEVSVTVNEAGGNNTFGALEREFGPGENCIKVNSSPVTLSVNANDTEGLGVVSIKTLPAKIVPGSVNINAPGSEISRKIRTEDSTDILNITVDEESPGTAEITVSFDLEGSLPFAVTASAADQAGNSSSVPQFSIRESSDLTVCRGDQL